MSTHILRPTSVVSGDGYYTATGAASVLAAVNDNSDSTYVRKSGGSAWSRLTLVVPRPTLSADEACDHIAGVARYKGTNGKMHEVGVFEGTYEGAPGFYASSATATNIAPGWVHIPIAYLNDPNVATFKLAYLSEEASADSTRAYIYELYGEARTITKATAVPGARTETASVNPSIPLTVTAAIDAWVGTDNSWNNIRTILVDIQIESDGTGYGTGTVVTTETKSFYLTEGGAHSLTAAIDESLANGTYKVYTRARRFTSERNGAKWELVGAWSTAATLNMQAPIPESPVVSTSKSTRYMSVRVTPVATTGYTNPLVSVERSTDGSTWTPVRNGTLVAGEFGTVTAINDYECGYGVETLYRARITGTYAGLQNAGAWTTLVDGVELDVSGWNIKCPQDLSLNMYDVHVVGEVSEKMEEDVSVFRPLDRDYAVAVSGSRGGWDGSLSIKCNTTTEWETLKALIESQKVLLLEDIYGGSKYIRVTNNDASKKGPRTSPRRSVTLSYVETKAP